MSLFDIKLIQGDCLEVMDNLISQNITVDSIITDPPYGTTACKWDSVIPFDEMWLRLNKLIKPNGAIVLFGSEPFSSALRMSNIKNYKYDWVWDKKTGTNYLNAKKMHTKGFENIMIFYRNLPTYNPQMETGKPFIDNRSNQKNIRVKSEVYRSIPKTIGQVNKGVRYPRGFIKISSRNNNPIHPTQKPVALMEYLIKTYTNENETVLDFTMGSGTTMLACKNTNRKGIGIELDKNYFEIAEKRCL